MARDLINGSDRSDRPGGAAVGRSARPHVTARWARLDELGRSVRVATVLGDGAACVGVDPELRDAFFATSRARAAVAQRVCESCPVRAACLAGAVARDEQWGVWGGRLFRPRIVKVWVHRRSADTDGRWEVCVVDAEGRRRRWGRFITQAQAQSAANAAADRWAVRTEQSVPHQRVARGEAAA